MYVIHTLKSWSHMAVCVRLNVLLDVVTLSLHDMGACKHVI